MSRQGRYPPSLHVTRAAHSTKSFLCRNFRAPSIGVQRMSRFGWYNIKLCNKIDSLLAHGTISSPPKTRG